MIVRDRMGLAKVGFIAVVSKQSARAAIASLHEVTPPPPFSS